MTDATRVLVLNAGSSSLKYQLLDAVDGTRIAGGVVERIGEAESPYKHSTGDGNQATGSTKVPDHAAALRLVAEHLDDEGLGLSSPQLAAIGHRAVHGGTRFTEPVLIDDQVVEGMKELVPLAPLHNPANITGIEVARRLRPDLPQVAVFDTAFHSTIPEAAARYAIDRATADEYGIRRYGFHGTSHAYVSRKAAELIGRPLEDVNTIVLHLGNGASATAVRGGVSVETSMGLTPLEGLVMGTRSGDLDPAIVLHLQRTAGLTADETDDLLNKRSGMLGLCGENDMREVVSRAEGSDSDAVLALDVYTHRLRKYVGAYLAVLGRVDVIAFTAGVGENNGVIRAAALDGLDGLGIGIDPVRNSAPEREARVISPEGTKVTVAVVPTDEEYEIARQTYELVRGPLR